MSQNRGTWSYAMRLGALVAMLAVLASCSTGTSTPPASTFPGESVVQATPSSSSSSGQCAVVRYAPPSAPAFANTMWPSERHDEWRTAAAPGGLPASISGPLRTASAPLPPVPVWGYVGQDGNLYVLGGSSFGLDIFTKLVLGDTAPAGELLAESLAYSETLTPYVAQVDPSTMAVRILELTEKISVNYSGGMLVHSNGFLYAVARGVLHKIDPATFSVILSSTLPLPPDRLGSPNFMTGFNGIQATLDGDLLVKGFSTLGDGPGILLRLSAVDFSIKAQLISDDIAGARMAVATELSKQYVYLVGRTQTLRYLVEPTAFTLDGAFSQQYLASGSGATEGTSAIFMGAGIVFTNNTSPAATSPIQIFAQAAADGTQLQSLSAFAGSSVGWNFFMVSGDPFQSGYMAVQNQANGAVSGFLACSGGAAIEKVWENDSIHESAGMAINTLNGQLYADDHDCNGNTCSLHFVVLDLHSGTEIARTAVPGTKPSMGQIFIGTPDAVFYLASDTNEPNGWITRITAP